jgi:hypothetical protein
MCDPWRCSDEKTFSSQGDWKEWSRPSGRDSAAGRIAKSTDQEIGVELPITSTNQWSQFSASLASGESSLA